MKPRLKGSKGFSNYTSVSRSVFQKQKLNETHVVFGPLLIEVGLDFVEAGLQGHEGTDQTVQHRIADSETEKRGNF